MSVLIVGSVALDDIDTPSGSKKNILGGSASHAGTASAFFAPTSLVAIIGSDFPKKHINYFKQRDINLDGLEIIEGGKTFHWSGYYEKEDMNSAISRSTCLNVFENFQPVIPASQKKSRFVLLGNILPELQLQVLDQVKNPALTLLDTMNFWITGKRDELLKVFKRVDLVCINDGEARMLCEESNLILCAKQILKMGPKYVIIKKGEHGSLLMSKDFYFSAPAFPLTKVVDPTGAGDSFAGGFLGYLSQKKRVTKTTMCQAVIAGTVLASYNCQGFGIAKTSKLKTTEIKSRIHELAKISDYAKLDVKLNG